jgi:hypothetical protein
VWATKQRLQPFGDESKCEVDATDMPSVARIVSARIKTRTAYGIEALDAIPIYIH